MINSNQINSLMAQQQQQHMMLQMGSPQAVVGASQYPPQFNFGQNPMFTSHLSGGGGIAGGLAAGVSGLGKGLGAAAGVTGLASMAGIGGATVGGAAGAMLGLNPLTIGLMGAGAGIGMVGNAMMQGQRMNSGVGNFLSQHQFANPMAPGGFGFSYGDQNRMTQTMIGMGAGNAFVGQQDQMQLLNQFQQMGLDKGVTSMGKMIEKFKEFSKTTEEVAMQLGKSVSEVAGVVGQLKGQGFYSAAEVQGQVRNMSSTASYGVALTDQVALSGQMSQQARAMGMSGASGAALSTNLTHLLGAANQGGMISENRLLDITGATNSADAITQLSGKLGGRLGSAMTGGGPLEALLSGFVTQDEQGNMSIDQAALNDVGSGRMSISDLKTRGSDLLSNSKSRGKFMANRRQLASDFLQNQGGTAGILGMFRNLSSERAAATGADEEDIFKKLLQDYQIAGEREADLLYDLSQEMDTASSLSLRNRVNHVAAEKRRAYLAREKSFGALKRKVGHEIGKVVKNPYLSGRFAAASNNLSSGLNALERQIYGTEVSTAALFTEENVGDFKNRFIRGELDDMQFGGQAANPYQRGLSASLGNMDSMGSFLTSTVGEERAAELKAIGKRRLDSGDLSNLNYHTSSDMAKRTVFSTHTGGLYRAHGLAGGAVGGGLGAYGGAAAGVKLGAMAGTFVGGPIGSVIGAGIGGLAGGIAGLFGGGAIGSGIAAGFGDSDDKRIYERLMSQAMGEGGAKDIAEAHAMISEQGIEERGALQRYLKSTGGLGQQGLVNLAKDQFLGKAGAGGGMSAGGRMAAGAAGGALLGSVVPIGGTIFGGILGGIGGGIAGLMYGGGDDEFQAKLESGVGTKLLSKMTTKGQLRKFDEMVRREMAANGNDKEAAYAAVAKKMGNDVTPEDVGTALQAMENASGMDHIERSKTGKYNAVIDLAKGAKGYQDAEILSNHLDEIASSVAGESGVEDLQKALSSGGVERSERTRKAMMDIARRASTGDFEYSGDNEMIKALASSGDINESLQKLVGQDITALDDALGQKGAGKQLRKDAGVRATGSLSEKELRKMSQHLAMNKSLDIVKPLAAQGAASLGAGSDDEMMKATTELLNSSNKLAIYVDNIAATLTGNETAGQSLPNITVKDDFKTK